MIEESSLRRTKDLLNLPPINFVDEYLTMESDQEKFYNDIKKSIKKEFKETAKKECDKITLKTGNLLSLVTRLRQATSCPEVLTTMNISSCKINRCLDLVEEITSHNNKVVIMSNFKEPIYTLQKLLKDYNPLVATGDTKDEDIAVDLFQHDNEHKVFLCTIQKMGTGFTLNRASYMIFIDQPWTASSYRQAYDRIHRIGSKQPVFIYNLLCENTIDIAVDKIIEKKKELGEYLVDGIESESNNMLNVLMNSIDE